MILISNVQQHELMTIRLSWQKFIFYTTGEIHKKFNVWDHWQLKTIQCKIELKYYNSWFDLFDSVRPMLHKTRARILVW